jgi:hypothetical protein
MGKEKEKNSKLSPYNINMGKEKEMRGTVQRAWNSEGPGEGDRVCTGDEDRPGGSMCNTSKKRNYGRD